jgi:hypothetical protein
MNNRRRVVSCAAFLLSIMVMGISCWSLQAQTLDENALKGMKWRQVGPFRGGRALAVLLVAFGRPQAAD